MRISLDEKSDKPLYRQIQDYLREQIQLGSLPPGVRLPGTRELAADLGVNRITVTNAYAELEAEGLILSQGGSGTYVAGNDLAGQPGRGSPPADGDWPLWQQELLSRSWKTAPENIDINRRKAQRSDLIDLSGGIGAFELFPVDDFRRVLQNVLKCDGAGALQYSRASGSRQLRTIISQILASQGTPAQPEEILITSGSQQGITLVTQLLLRPGDVVIVEKPTYSGVIALLRAMDIRLLGFPVDDQGMRIELLEEALRDARPRLIYTIPTFQNPTGITMSGLRRRQLLALAGRYNVPILEDEFAADLLYDGCAYPALKALDTCGRVIYAGTFSKIIMPALRIGYLVASGPVYNKLRELKWYSDCGSSELMQRALGAFITIGRYQSHLHHARQVYRRRRDVMMDALKRYLPQGAQWRLPQGGLFIWLQLPQELSADDLYPLAIDEGVAFAVGSIFFPCERASPFLRLNFAMSNEEIIEEGIKRLARAVEAALVERNKLKTQ